MPQSDVSREEWHSDLASLGDAPGSRFAVAALQSAALRPGRDLNPIVIYGVPGAGKTTLLHACRRRVEESGHRAALLDAGHLKRVVVGARSDDAHHRCLRQLSAGEFLLVDGIDDLAAFPVSARDVLDTLTASIALGQQVVVTATSREFELLRTWVRAHDRALVTDVASQSALAGGAAPPGAVG